MADKDKQNACRDDVKVDVRISPQTKQPAPCGGLCLKWDTVCELLKRGAGTMSVAQRRELVGGWNPGETDICQITANRACLTLALSWAERPSLKTVDKQQEFMKCAPCMKHGSVVLCKSCRRNRETIDELKKQIEGLTRDEQKVEGVPPERVHYRFPDRSSGFPTRELIDIWLAEYEYWREPEAAGLEDREAFLMSCAGTSAAANILAAVARRLNSPTGLSDEEVKRFTKGFTSPPSDSEKAATMDLQSRDRR